MRHPKQNPRYKNGAARRKVRERLKHEGRGCWICKVFGRPDRIDYDLPPGHPMSFVVDELKPVSRWREFGYRSAQECALDYSNLGATHRFCNEWKGNKSDVEVIAIARGQLPRKNTPLLPRPFDEW